MKTGSRIICAALVVAMLAATGCVKIWQESLDIKTYMIETSREGAAMQSPLADKLWIDTVTVLPPFNVRSLIVRKNDVEYETSYYTELLLSPANNVRNNLFTWFSDSGIFENVSITDRKKISHRLTVTVLKLHGERMPQGNEAVMILRASLLDELTEGVGVLFSREYERREPVAEVNAEELIRAYNRALTQILAECEADVAAALKAAGEQ